MDQSAPAVGWGQGSPAGTSGEVQSLDKAGVLWRAIRALHGPLQSLDKAQGALEGN